MNKVLKVAKRVAMALAITATAVAFVGCESDDETVHKITLHNKSSYTVVQRLSNYGNVTIEAGKKRAFDDEMLTLYEYSPSKYVIRIRENSHTFVYKNR